MGRNTTSAELRRTNLPRWSVLPGGLLVGTGQRKSKFDSMPKAQALVWNSSTPAGKKPRISARLERIMTKDGMLFWAGISLAQIRLAELRSVVDSCVTF